MIVKVNELGISVTIENVKSIRQMTGGILRMTFEDGSTDYVDNDNLVEVCVNGNDRKDV